MASAQTGRWQDGRPQTAPTPRRLHLPRPERRRWRRAERRVLREHQARQLAMLRSLAANGGRLTALAYQHTGGYAVSAEFTVDRKKIRAARVHRPTLSALTEAIGDGPAIPLLAASRYGPYWVLTFDLATAPLVVLADGLSILPCRPGGSAWPAAPAAPADGGRRSAETAWHMPVPWS
jgi:hypothetical protein